MQIADGSSDFVRSFRLYLSVQGLSPRTIRSYCRAAQGFLTFWGGRGLESICATDLRAYYVFLRQERAAKTVREIQLSLRRFFRFLCSEQIIISDPTKEIRLMNFRTPPQPTYAEAEVKRLLVACDQSSREGIRDAAIVTVLFDTGVREGELVSMEVPDWDKRKTIVSGKTGYRAVPLGSSALRAIDRYVRRWRIQDGTLWRGLKGELTESGVLQIVRRLCKKAGVTHKGVHGFRRAAAAQMKRLGMNDSDILEVMGWKDVTMLRRYVAEVAEDLAFAAHRRYSPADNLRRAT